MAANLWWAMFVFATLVLLVVTGLWLYAMNRSGDTDPDDGIGAQRQTRRWIVGGGLVLPVASMSVLLLFGIPAGHRMLPLPPDQGEALRVNVTAHQWWWEVGYPTDDLNNAAPARRNEVHIPARVPVDIHLQSADVIHSFWVPRLAGKLDMIPGRTNILRIQAHETGVYRGVCAEFCGLAHAHMQFEVHVHEPEDFRDWMTMQQQNGAADD